MQPAAAAEVTKPSAKPPAALATVVEPDQDLQLRAVLAAPAVVTAAERGAHLATATTQPAHQQEPPPLKPSVPRTQKAPEIPVVCKLCHTRMYARPEQVGTLMRCPDCHTENLVPAPKAAAVKTPQPVSLDEGTDFVLSAPAQRPAYKPMVEPRGEYAELKFLDPSAPPRPAERPPDRPQQPRAALTETTMTFSGTRPADDDEEGEEITISAPVERIDLKQVVKLPEPDDPDEDNQYRGTFRDDEWGFPANPNEKEAWKKSPFYYGILGFLFYPQTLFRLVFYSLVMSLDLALLLGAVYCAQQGETPLLFAAVGLTVASAGLSTAMVGGAFPCLMAITQDTANGCDAVENWPDWNIAEWLLSSMTVPAAAFLAALPGAVVASAFISMGKEALLVAPFPILLSELMFFPIVFGSMLAEASLMPVSGAILKSMQQRGDGWLLFYLASILLGIVLTASIALIELGIQLGTLLVAPFAAVLWVASLILYFRLLGRLLWYAQNYRRERDKPE